MRECWLGLAWLVLCVVSAARVPGAEVHLWTRARTLQYSVDAAVLANEAMRKDQEVGWRVSAALDVTAAACAEHEALLHFQMHSPELLLRGAASNSEWFARESLWDAPAQRDSSFYAHWRAGEVVSAFLDPNDPPAVAGFKRGLLSIFQFQILDGERNETDVSGECDVLYETLNENDFRKIKRGCKWAGEGDSEGREEGGGVTSRRLTRYSLRGSQDAVSSAHAEEVHELTAIGAGEADAAVKVRAWLRLQLTGEKGGSGDCALDGAGLGDAIAALPAHLEPTTLLLPNAPIEEPVEYSEDDSDAPLSLEEALRLSADLATPLAGAGGDVTTARLLLRVLPSLAAAPADALKRHLHLIQDLDALTGAARALGATGTAAAIEAACAALQLRGDPLQPAGDALLAALSTARLPHPAAVRAALTLATDAGTSRVRAAALLAAAAAARRAGPAVADSVRDELAKQLARCKDDSCRCLMVSALGNLRREDTATLLLELATKGAGGGALCAARALAAAPRAALPPRRAPALLLVALNTSRAVELRAAALELGVRCLSSTPFALTAVARALRGEQGPAAHELRRVLWGRLTALAEQGSEQARLFIAAAKSDEELGSWDAWAHAGTSSVLVRDAGWGAGGWAARLDSAQVAGGGVLRRGVVDLALLRGDSTTPALAVEMWTRGLHALAGAGAGAGGEEGEGEGAAGGLGVEVAGARLPDITLFESQAELLGHVWSGTGSSPTAVTRSLVPLSSHARAVPLAPGAVTSLLARSAGALALDAHAAVSLWARTAAARLELRAAVAAEATVKVHSPWGRVSVTANAAAPAQLAISSDLDFYDRVSLCVRAAISEHEYARNATLTSQLGARNWRVKRARTARTLRPARTLALGRENDAACRLLAPHTEH